MSVISSSRIKEKAYYVSNKAVRFVSFLLKLGLKSLHNLTISCIEILTINESSMASISRDLTDRQISIVLFFIVYSNSSFVLEFFFSLLYTITKLSG